MTVTYRKATINDAEVLTRLRIEFLKGVQPAETRQYSEAELQVSLNEYFSKNLENEQFVAVLAISDGEIIATSGLCFFQITPGFTLIDGREAYILNIFTLPEWRGKGIGKRIFELILQEAIDRGYKRIALHATDAGRPMYEKFGFKLSGDEMTLAIA